ncbi:MAG: pectin acetylesterase [Butyrivibrio sp.]|nr:pectin acetylesterase [Butyrivibrio sp.]
MEDLRDRLEERSETLASHVGDFVENSLGKAVEQPIFLAPFLEGSPEPMTWYSVPLSTGCSGDGSEYHIYVKVGTLNRLCVFFSGGGVAWNEYTAARPVTGGKMAAGLPNYYWNNLRPVTQIMNINVGITDLFSETNPFRDWCFVVITYSTGDLHVGDGEFEYEAVDGSRQTLHFHGYRNFLSAMEVGKRLFPEPESLLIAGNSAGAFAVSALAGEVAQGFYPNCGDVTLLSDSGQLLYKDWRRTARDIWRSPEWIWQPVNSDNITLCWFRELYHTYGRRFRYLYSTSIHDYLLSAYYSDVTFKRYRTDAEVQEAFFHQTVEMVHELKAIDPEFGIYLNDWHIPLVTKGGSVHTTVREVYFTTLSQDGVTQAQWLADAVAGRVYDVGLSLIDTPKGADYHFTST